jgi:ribose-phosphate pyrophosphokinase
MASDRSVIAVPTYVGRTAGVSYLGDMVFDYLDEHHKGSFEKVELEVRGSADGTEEAVTEGHVRERDVYVIHPLVLRGQPSRHVMVAQQISDNLHRSDASEVVLFDPYNPYFSYDKRKGKQPLTARIVADAYRSAHIDRVFTVDPHSDMLGLAFGSECPLEPLQMQIPLANHFRERHELGNVTVCSPDIGGYNRAEVFADLLDVPLIALRKRRSEKKSDDTRSLGIVGERAHIEGRTIVFRDDVIRTAGSLVEAQRVLRDAGASDFYVVATHLSLDGPARDRIKESGMKVIGTNTVPQEFSAEEQGIYDVLDISDIVAEVIYNRSEGLSIGEFFRTFRRNGRK